LKERRDERALFKLSGGGGERFTKFGEFEKESGHRSALTITIDAGGESGLRGVASNRQYNSCSYAAYAHLTRPSLAAPAAIADLRQEFNFHFKKDQTA
jgi:hypothetical protein